MARYYARFNHGFEVTLGGTGSAENFFERRVIGSDTSSNAFLIAKREALSNAMYAQLNAGSRDPSVGPIIPQSSNPANPPVTQNITRTGGNLEWQKVYRTTAIPGVVPPTDFRTRPTSSIYTDDGNLTEITPSDPGSISDTLYTDAADAVANVLASIKKTKSGLTPIAPPFTEDGSPYTRLGTNPGRTLHSIWHDKDLNYFAWDDFTPGQPQAFTTSFPQATGLGNVYLEDSDDLSVVLEWVPEFLSDRAGDVPINAELVRDGTSDVAGTLSTTVSNGNLYYSWSLAASNFPVNITAPYSYEYDLNSDIKFRDATIPAHESSLVTNNVDKAIEVFKVVQVTVFSAGTEQGVCDDISSQTVYMNGDIANWFDAAYIWSNKSGAAASAGFYARSGDTCARSWDGGGFTVNGNESDPCAPDYPLPCTCCTGTGGGGGGGASCGQACTTSADCTGSPTCPTCTDNVCVQENFE